MAQLNLTQTRVGDDIRQEPAEKPLAGGRRLRLLYQKSIDDAGTWK